MNLNELSKKLEDHLTNQDIQDAQELLDNTYQEIVDMRSELVEAQAELAALRTQAVADAAEIERLKVGHDRYEILRKLNVVQFQALYTKALQSYLPFDDLVDILGGSK